MLSLPELLAREGKVPNEQQIIKENNMAIVTWKGWREEPEEDWQQAYDVLTGRKKPFYVVFGRPETLNNQSEKDLDDQAELGENEE